MELPAGDCTIVLRVPYLEVFEALDRALRKLSFAPERAALCGRLFADSSRDGVYSHGLDRFPRFVRAIQSGIVDVQAEPRLVTRFGALERWDGMGGPGNLNAFQSMRRAIAISREHGMGCVALAHTNHWMRGGSYGWQAADAGALGICWTNTMPNLPPWGASDARVGNNPLVIAVPRPEGHVVLDMAMSQFSYGALASYRARGEQLPVEGGFDLQGELTRDPGAIEASNRPLPIGYWKGSGLALMLDMMAGLLAAGQVTHQIPTDPERETNLSQVFLAFSVSSLDSGGPAAHIADEIIRHLHSPSLPGEHVRYPGERTLKIREENLTHGIPVPLSVWRQILEI